MPSCRTRSELKEGCWLREAAGGENVRTRRPMRARVVRIDDRLGCGDGATEDCLFSHLYALSIVSRLIFNLLLLQM